MTTTERIRVGTVLAVAACVLCALGAPQCSGGGESADASGDVHDSALDRSVDTSTDMDAPITCAQPLDDAGRVADWSGWRRLTELDPCCAADVAVDLTQAPPYSWVPCTNGAPNCVQFDDTSWDASTHILVASILPGSSNTVRQLLLSTRTTGSVWIDQQNLYDAQTSATIAAWRLLDSDPTCLNGPSLVVDGVTLTAIRTGKGVYLAHGNGGAWANVPQYERLGADPNFVPPADLDAQPIPISVGLWLSSLTTWAYEIPLAGLVGRKALGADASTPYTTATGGGQFHLGMVVGNDVFAWSTYGSVGWGELYVVDANGNRILLRSNPNAHVGGIGCDGANLYWAETYGSTNVTTLQNYSEIWTAPYTSDPMTLTTTAKKLATIPNTFVGDLEGISGMGGGMPAFGGIYMFYSRYEKATVLVRATDSAVLHVPGPGSFDMAGPIYASQDELWAMTSGPHLVRLTLPDW